MYTTNMRYTFVSCKGNHGQIVIKKAGGLRIHRWKVLVVLVRSRVRLERFYYLKKESLRVFVVLGGRGIYYGWMVKRV